ncbi:nucleoside triphosphate pyrophosphohydrolase [Sphingobium phenoxybenzoativorans]|uniref:Nucleoside triphosphate pyrophosphohydrolase n=1 Tax=Sphingobium phenoxybenzoativorans TaxID=1592790 RepID=A0A975KB96_9SPHN|nr:nucleoside triphosphate pyrophosphohydrolase [Sphingobium phenoxybenzoativorans]QUT08241.1 nucleoside triphosphate pyrophosphohydrolase [Sphingobium phenoxybenzoativorans]
MPLARVMARLRDPVTGCPWDIEQNFSTIAPYTIEEAYEVADAIQRDDMAALKDELGDLLLQTVFHARMAEQAGYFALQDVIENICAKMVRRHPHVFGDVHAQDGVAAQMNWEAIKAAERAEKESDPSALAGVAIALPALLRAEKLQKRAARTGFDWPDTGGVIAKIQEEIVEVETATSPAHREEEIGDLLFAVVNLARHHRIDPETALRGANVKFEKRFRAMEDQAGAGFAALSLDDKEKLWQAAKQV